MKISRQVRAALSAAFLALVGAGAAVAADVCGECTAKELCATHGAALEAAFEEWGEALTSEDEGERIEALVALAELSHEHANAPSERAAEALAQAMDDPSLRVRQRVARLLANGQHPEIAVRALVRECERIKQGLGNGNLVQTLASDSDETQVAMAYIANIPKAAGELKDDRCVEIIYKILKQLPAETRGQPIFVASCDALLELGTAKSVEAVFETLSPWSDDPGLRRVHNSVLRCASRRDLEGMPDWGEDCVKGWRKWWRVNKRAFPAKLGKAKLVLEED